MTAGAPRIVRFLTGHRQINVGGANDADISTLTDHTCQQIGVENQHIATRIGWMLTLNGFLFASFGLSLGKAVFSNFRNLLCWTGIASSSLTAIGVFGAYMAINSLRDAWLKAPKPDGELVPFVQPWPSLMGRIPSLGICIALLIVWLRLLEPVF